MCLASLVTNNNVLDTNNVPVINAGHEHLNNDVFVTFPDSLFINGGTRQLSAYCSIEVS